MNAFQSPLVFRAGVERWQWQIATARASEASRGIVPVGASRIVLSADRFELKPREPYGAPSPSPDNTLYQLSPGKHRIMVTRAGSVVVDRVVVLDNQTTMEVQIP